MSGGSTKSVNDLLKIALLKNDLLKNITTKKNAPNKGPPIAVMFFGAAVIIGFIILGLWLTYPDLFKIKKVGDKCDKGADINGNYTIDNNFVCTFDNCKTGFILGKDDICVVNTSTSVSPSAGPSAEESRGTGVKGKLVCADVYKKKGICPSNVCDFSEDQECTGDFEEYCSKYGYDRYSVTKDSNNKNVCREKL